MSAPRSLVPGLLAALAAGSLILTGCSTATSTATSTAPAAGVSAAQTAQVAVPGADVLWGQVKDLMTNAKSVHMSGTAARDGKTVKLDVAGNRAGSNQTLKITQDGGTATLITADGMTYIRGDKKFWANQGTTVSDPKVLAKYVATKADPASAMSVGSMFDEMSKGEFNIVDAVNLQVTQTTVDGKPAFEISERVASKNEPHIWTTADGKGTLIKLDAKDDSGAQTSLSFSEWDAVPTVKAPPASQVIKA